MMPKRTVLLLVFSLFLAACAGRSGTAVDDPVFDDAVTGPGTATRGVGDRDFGRGDAFGDDVARPGPQGGVLDSRVIYFDFDRSDVRPEYTEMLQAHGRWLAANPQARLRLEGHTDERGTREYNIGLGERRAQAVRRVLLLQGVDSSQLVTVSFGEERPAVIGSDEEAYALNRRVELIYVQ
ncbi:MAG: peptidoglycan-associated lipoprotein Pal [Chromatiales bacterium]|nr:peptidoglycan-associated lipoprotein Pal [Chromatiales bacterium]